jgi:Flp pilus assembly protein TadD/mono/diheme cytochrome c family protein
VTAPPRPRATLLLLALAAGCAAPAAPGSPVSGAPAPVTFADVAPILHRRCAACHRPDGLAPFALLAYADARARTDEIAEMVGRRAMPPWLPEPGPVRFRDERRLPAEEIARILAWVAAGAPEGDRAAVPPGPSLPPGWPLGPPDLVLRLSEPYPLPAGGGDVFRNFVLPLPVSAPAWVRAVDFRPGAAGRVHHATLLVDGTGEARRLDALDAEPGYAGMEGGVAPDGHFVGWSPGRQPRPLPGGLTWGIRPGMDLVLQLHLMPGPRPERVQPEIGLYLAPRPAAARGVTLHLAATVIDIPAGEPAYTVRDTYVLPADVDVLAIYPHAHHLCREMTVEAARRQRPDAWGVLQNLGVAHVRRGAYAEALGYLRAAVALQPGSPAAHESLATTLALLGRLEEAAGAYDRALALRPDPDAHNNAGVVLARLGRPVEAERHYRAALALRPDDPGAGSNLGVLLARLGRDDEAVEAFVAVLAARPDHAPALRGLGAVVARRADRPGGAPALAHLEAALAAGPGQRAGLEIHLGLALAALGRLDDGARHLEAAAEGD